MRPSVLGRIRRRRREHDHTGSSLHPTALATHRCDQSRVRRIHAVPRDGMMLQNTPTIEGSTATLEHTAERSFLGVDQGMPIQVRLVRESLPAGLAEEGSFPGMDPHMAFECGGAAEAGAAADPGASEGPDLGVERPDVPLETVAAAQFLVAAFPIAAVFDRRLQGWFL